MAPLVVNLSYGRAIYETLVQLEFIHEDTWNFGYPKMALRYHIFHGVIQISRIILHFNQERVIENTNISWL